MNIIIKILRKICRSLAKIVFPNSFRIFLLKVAGIRIGEQVFVNEGFTLACSIGQEGNLLIEDRVAIAPNTIIVLTSDPNFSNLRKLKDIYSFVDVKGEVHIKHDAWIGAGCIILPNVTIGEFSIVGAGSVVTKSVPPFSVVAGNPARVIKKIDEDVAVGLL